MRVGPYVSHRMVMIRKSIHSIIILYNALLGANDGEGNLKSERSLSLLKLDTGVLKLKPEIIKRGAGAYWHHEY